MKVVRKLDVEADSTIEVVEVVGMELILKTCDVQDVAMETRFVELLAKHGIPHLELFQDTDLKPNQLLMEYAPGSLTVGLHPTSEWYKKWGRVTRLMHNVSSSRGVEILPDGSEKDVTWHEYIERCLRECGDRHLKRVTLSAELVEKTSSIIRGWLYLHHDVDYRLIHGDLHANSAMIRGNEVVLFDKGSTMLYGNRFYDLAVAVLDRYGGDDPDNLTNAFVEGYGASDINANLVELEHWLLMRCFERHPNRFEPHIEEVLNSLVSKYG